MEKRNSRNNTQDTTLERNYLQKWQFLIAEYEDVKAGRHAVFKRVGDFYNYHQTCSQTFRKYYNRYLQEGCNPQALLPQKRGPRWKSRRTPPEIEAKALRYRELGNNRYEIAAILRERDNITLSPSTIYRICKRHGKGRITHSMVTEKRRIIKNKMGELGHIDLHQLSKDSFMEPLKTQPYVLAVIDSCSRLAWADVVESKKAVPVAFKALKVINTLHHRYGITFEEMLSDNGAEFASRTNVEGHAFEYMLMELDIKHRYTRPYRPQTNGKVERFNRTLVEEWAYAKIWTSDQQRANSLDGWLYGYNHHRHHTAINGIPHNAVTNHPG